MREFWKFVQHDWYFAIPMFCMSLVAITMVVWRLCSTAPPTPT